MKKAYSFFVFTGEGKISSTELTKEPLKMSAWPYVIPTASHEVVIRYDPLLTSCDISRAGQVEQSRG